ncbi:fatty acid cis/trans isomerase [Hahella ganghwensis]|uniref:fatty acid cis/trans isomerase n=1 Tax=Hahella ganghwensis TaxID=286420 RepID=UPI0003771205|nr:fatty acid cis/trans isomerase [Hahella ganghwensis]
MEQYRLNRIFKWGICVSVIFILSCASTPVYQVIPRSVSATQTYSYSRDIQPIFDRKCVACHACNDAPCQLKLSSGNGVERGASKIPVYDGGRLEDLAPTRLNMDAQTESQWRAKGFYSVIAADNSKEEAFSPAPSLMEKMLTLGYQHPTTSNQPVDKEIELGISRENSCPSPGEFDHYAADHPREGMPFAVSGLTEKEYLVIKTWLEEGGMVDQPSGTPLNENIQHQIIQWEEFFNASTDRQKLLARYLFEHLYLAHLLFRDSDSKERFRFFKLVRSFSPPGYPIEPVATVRPNGDPGRSFFYRLQPLEDSIVHKTHIVYEMNESRYLRYQELFLDTDWDVSELPGYEERYASNPFLTFSAIPAKSRYQFMLDEAEYFTRTFIRGPVCRGQIATDVIRDQFWVMFEDPESEQFVNSIDYQQSVTPLLGVPGHRSELGDLGSEWFEYKEKRNRYLEERKKQYRRRYPQGAEIEHIWDGDTYNANAFLTIFRHHDSASVTKGWRGKFPLTLWLMDYPLFERTYYELVVGFNVFGSISHQAQTRLYFDLIRNGGETNFLRMLPPGQRKAVYKNWYQNSGKIKTAIVYHELDVSSPTSVDYNQTGSVKDQLVQNVIKENPHLLGSGDSLNRCHLDICSRPANNQSVHEIDDQFRRLANAEYTEFPGLQFLPEVTFVRVDTNQSDYLVYSLIRNRAHSNVAFMLGEGLRYQPEKDSITVLPELIGSYPNYSFRVPASDVEDFVSQLINVDSKEERRLLIDQWGIRISHPEFWEVFHSFRDYMEKQSPEQAGIYDMNRYEGW